MKKLFATGGLISTLLIAGVLAALAMPRHQVLAFIVVGTIEFYVWWRRHDSTVTLAFDTYSSWLMSLVAVVLVAISPQVISQILIIVAFVLWRLAIHLGLLRKHPGVEALIMQFASLGAIFSAAQVWRWAAAIVMVLAWGSSWLVARKFLVSTNDKQGTLLAGVWGLVVAELAWIMSWWMIAYLSPGAFLIIPQAALLITGIAYILGGIYRLHRMNQLSRNRLFEYLVVASVLLVIILAGTHWNGAS
jgi:hypothetical protein